MVGFGGVADAGCPFPGVSGSRGSNLADTTSNTILTKLAPNLNQKHRPREFQMRSANLPGRARILEVHRNLVNTYVDIH